MKPIMCHEGEGILFVNANGLRGAIMVGGISYDLTAVQRQSGDKSYLSITARERKAPSLAPPAKLPGRSQRVQEALDRLSRDYKR